MTKDEIDCRIEYLRKHGSIEDEAEMERLAIQSVEMEEGVFIIGKRVRE